MIKRILFVVLFCLVCSVASATNWCDDANNQACFLMEDSGTESNESANSSDGVSEVGGTMPQDADKKFGTYSRDFESGDTEYLEQADGLSTDISGADQELTVVAWVKIENTGTIRKIVSKYSTCSGCRGYELFINGSNYLHFYKSTDSVSASGFDEVIGTTTLTTGNWYHVAVVYDDVTITLYLDGVVEGTPLVEDGGILNNTQTFQIGARITQDYYDGLIDEVAVFDTALTQANIQDIMNNGLVQAATTRRRMWLN